MQAYRQTSTYFQELYGKRRTPQTSNTYSHAIQLAMRNSQIAESADISYEGIIRGTHNRKGGNEGT